MSRGAEGAKDSITGKAKDVWGSLTGDNVKQAEGKAQQAKGGEWSRYILMPSTATPSTATPVYTAAHSGLRQHRLGKCVL